MIVSFADRDMERVYLRQRVKRLDSRVQTKALTKFLLLDAVCELSEFRVPPEKRPEALRGDRTGQQCIRTNDQWQICFVWTVAGLSNVEIIDYH